MEKASGLNENSTFRTFIQFIPVILALVILYVMFVKYCTELAICCYAKKENCTDEECEEVIVTRYAALLEVCSREDCSQNQTNMDNLITNYY